MKGIKVVIIATIITAIIMISTAFAMPAAAEAAEFYEVEAVVIGWERIGDTELRTIDCFAEDGTIWSFYDDEGEFQIGDLVVLTMWICGESDEDDEVVDVVKIMHLNPVEVCRYMEN